MSDVTRRRDAPDARDPRRRSARSDARARSAIPLGVTVRSLDPVAGAPAGAVSDAHRRRARRPRRAARDRRGRRRRHLRVGGRARPARCGRWSPSGVRPAARRRRARGVPGPGRREDHVPRARHPGRRLRAGRRRRRSSPPRSPRSAPRRSSRPGAAATTARARRRSTTPADAPAAADALARRRAADPRAAHPVRPRALDHRGRAASTATSAPGRSSRTSTATASCARAHAPAPGVDAALAGDRRRATSAPCSSDFDYVGVLTLELFQVGDRAPRERDGAARAQLRSLDDRGRGARASSRTTSAPCSGGRSARPTSPAPSVMINCIGALPEPAAVLAVPGAHLHRYGKTPAARAARSGT